MSAAELFIARLAVPAETAPTFSDALDALEPPPVSVSILPVDDAPTTIEALFAARPDSAAIDRALRPIADVFDILAPECEIAPLPDRDWVAESLRRLGPVRAGRFRVLGTHLDPTAAGGIPLILDAGRAFGTGHHETTRGCLLALDWLACRPRLLRGPILDLGCGSGVLAMAAAHVFPGPLVAADIDPLSIRTARENLRLNGLAGRIRIVGSDGFAAPVIRRSAPYALIVANILAEPLKLLARDMRAYILPGGLLVLSGILKRQEQAVRAMYLAHGFVAVRRIVLGQWPTLILRAR